VGFLCFWLCGWVAGEFFAIVQIVKIVTGVEKPGGSIVAGFLIFWLAGWTLGGLFAGLQVVNGLLMMFGIERWTFEFGKLTRERSLWGMRLRRCYPGDVLTTLELAEASSGGQQFPGFSRLRFKEGKRTVFVAPMARSEEQEWLAEEFRELGRRYGMFVTSSAE
jgi:hypothetical protein